MLRRPSAGRHNLLSPCRQITIRRRHESGHSGGRPGHPHLGGIAPPAQADGRDRRHANSLARDEDLRPSRRRGFRRLPRLQGLYDQGVFLQLLPPRFRRDDRRAGQPHDISQHPCRSLADHADRHRRADADRRPAEARRAVSRSGRAVLLHLWRRRRRHRHCRRNRLPPQPWPQGDADRRDPARDATARCRSPATASSASSRSRRATRATSTAGSSFSTRR